MSKPTATRGTILEILRMSTEDGPGIRTTVFFKGCPLHCAWCHNPESISAKPQIQWMKTACIGCGICVEACPQKALSQTGDGDIIIDRNLCAGCGTCARECPSAAMELLGKPWDVSALADELAKDRVYFEKSGGGVTLSGGEAALQQDFCLALLKDLRGRGIATALDTCGQVPSETLAKLLPYVDLLLYDLKEIDSRRHRAFTGSGNEKILANAVFAAAFKKNHPYPRALWIRTPIIPDATDTPENIGGLGDFIREHLSGAVDHWELCAFNNLCRDKYERLGLAWPYASKDLPEKSRMEELARVAQSHAPSVRVSWSGATRLNRDAAPMPSDRSRKQDRSANGC